MKPRHVEDVEIEYDKIPHMRNLVTVKAMLEKMQTTLTAVVTQKVLINKKIMPKRNLRE
jgi:hypothetical protein